MNITSFVQVIWSAAALGLVALVLLHSPKGDGIGGIGGQAQLFTSAKTAETTLNRITWTLFVVFLGLTIVLSANWLPSNAPAAAPLPGITTPESNTVPLGIPETLPATPPTAPQPGTEGEN